MEGTLANENLIPRFHSTVSFRKVLYLDQTDSVCGIPSAVPHTIRFVARFPSTANNGPGRSVFPV